MKILAIISSSSRSRNTAKLVLQALDGAAVHGAEVEAIVLPEYRLEFCRGCMTCLRQGRCLLGDDLELIRAKMAEADGIILGSPTHGMAPNALMKNLLDRIGLYSVYTGCLSGKYLAGIASAGAMGAREAAHQLVQIGGSFYGRSYITGVLAAPVGWDAIDDHPEWLRRAYELGARMADDIAKKRTYPFQACFDRLLTALIVRRIITRNILNQKDGVMASVYQYHRERGRFE
jgi:multimeric flavodoxin WrbA